MIGKDCGVGKNADAQAGGDCGLDAGEVGARVGDMPPASGRFERVDGAIAIKTALREHGQRHRITAQIDGMAAACHLNQILRPSGDRAGFAGIALHEREIKLAALDIAAQFDAQITTDVEPETRP